MKRFWRILTFLIIGFLLLLGYRVIYNLTVDEPLQNTNNFLNSSDFSYRSRNYATAKIAKSSGQIGGLASGSGKGQIEQKYEKIAKVKSATEHFEDDVAKVKTLIKAYAGVIQYEKNQGQEGYRQIYLTIGIHPLQFDTFYQDIQSIGALLAKEITKTDKTNEYLNLNAQKRTKEQIKANLLALKSRGGNIAEFIELENRLLQIEEELQSLGVQLGDFDVENELSTVQYHLVEQPVFAPSFFTKFTAALEWTIQTYLLIVFLMALMTLFAFILIGAINQFKLIQKTVSALRKDDGMV